MSGKIHRRVNIVELIPPRQLFIRFWNPIEGAKFGLYALKATQLWVHKTYGSSVGYAGNNDYVEHALSGERTGNLTYSLYGVCTSGENKGLDICIGDFKTLGDALNVLANMGVITNVDRKNLQARAVGMEMAG